MNGYEFTLAGARLTALGSGALFWRDQNLLCVSDMHLGKTERRARLGWWTPCGGGGGHGAAARGVPSGARGTAVFSRVRSSRVRTFTASFTVNLNSPARVGRTGRTGRRVVTAAAGDV